MARARNLKPSFFTDDEIAGLDPLTRILFMGLWCLADREGRLEDKPKRIKVEVLPYEDVDCTVLLQCLHDARFIVRYERDGQQYIQVRQFKKHQHPHVKEALSTIPPPYPEPAPDKHRTSPEKNNPQPEIPERERLISDSLNRISDSLNPPPDSGFPQTAIAVGADPPAAANANEGRSTPVEIIPEKPHGKPAANPAERVAELAKNVLAKGMSKAEQIAAVAELQRLATKGSH